MPTLGLLCADEGDRQRLSLLAGEAGHLVCAAGRLPEAVEMLREMRPRLVLVVDCEQCDAQTMTRELLRAAPLLPVVVALKTRDAGRAVALLKTGAAEVVAPPWTSEGLRACVAKSLRFQGTAFSLARPARKPRGAVYLLAVLAFFAACFGVVALKRHRRLAAEEARRVSSWELPYRHPAAMAFDGQSLWIADWFTQSLYEHSTADPRISRLVHFPDETPVAVAFGDGAVWTASASGRVERRMRDAAWTPLGRYAAAAGLTGIAYDGLYLWTADARRRRLDKRLLDDRLTALASYPYPGQAPAALAFDGRDLWSLDSGNHELLRHNLERPEEVTARVSLPEYRDGRYRAVGLAWDGRRFWTVGERLPKDSGPARLFREAEIQP